MIHILLNMDDVSYVSKFLPQKEVFQMYVTYVLNFPFYYVLLKVFVQR